MQFQETTFLSGIVSNTSRAVFTSPFAAWAPIIVVHVTTFLHGERLNKCQAAARLPAFAYAEIMVFQETASRSGISSNSFLAFLTLSSFTKRPQKPGLQSTAVNLPADSEQTHLVRVVVRAEASQGHFIQQFQAIQVWPVVRVASDHRVPERRLRRGRAAHLDEDPLRIVHFPEFGAPAEKLQSDLWNSDQGCRCYDGMDLFQLSECAPSQRDQSRELHRLSRARHRLNVYTKGTFIVTANFTRNTE
ncbi:UDP-glucosyl transferase 73B5 [Striga asiatica]|uniref:UDP-glucosyl transferase 73B5 n=1 Tax=Striga asiatica TaxID=4170 RepID=A0A5A7R2K9_STRAF|nr:UDP-glucosyl transferase 73B5 [Striga asiatica]